MKDVAVVEPLGVIDIVEVFVLNSPITPKVATDDATYRSLEQVPCEKVPVIVDPLVILKYVELYPVEHTGVGTKVGVAVGIMVGNHDGTTVGTWVRIKVGINVGKKEGH